MADSLGYSSNNPMPEHLNKGPLHNLPDGFPFDSNSYIRRLAEPAAFALFPYIAGMTVMDDRIAAAVDRHSSFREHPWGRLLRTIDSAVVLVFGVDTEAIETAERMYSFHKTIKGSSEGVHYDANDADAQTWVLAAVFNGIQETKRRWAPPQLSGEQEEGLYQDIKTFGQFFGIDSSLQPENAGALKDYWEKRITSGNLLKTDVSRRMAQTVFRFTSPKVPKSLERLGQAITITSLDPRLQEQADIEPSLSDQRLATAFDRTMRHTYGRIPASVRRQGVPAYMSTRRRALTMHSQFSRLRAQNV